MYHRAYRTHPHKYEHRNADRHVKFFNAAAGNKLDNILNAFRCVKHNDICKSAGLLTVGLVGGYTIKSILSTK